MWRRCDLVPWCSFQLKFFLWAMPVPPSFKLVSDLLCECTRSSKLYWKLVLQVILTEVLFSLHWWCLGLGSDRLARRSRTTTARLRSRRCGRASCVPAAPPTAAASCDGTTTPCLLCKPSTQDTSCSTSPIESQWTRVRPYRSSRAYLQVEPSTAN